MGALSWGQHVSDDRSPTGDPEWTASHAPHQAQDIPHTNRINATCISIAKPLGPGVKRSF